MNKQEIILKLQELLSVSQTREDIYFTVYLTDVIDALKQEFDLSDMYAQEIRNALQMEETEQLLNNIKIR